MNSESVYNLESNWKYFFNKNRLSFSVFYSLLYNGIQRITLPGKQFKRINKDKIKTWGIEINSKLVVMNNVNLNFNISYLNSYSKNAKGEFEDTLEYKPQIISGLQIDYTFHKNFKILLEANYIGKEFGLKEGSEFFQELPSYFLLNLRTSYTFNIFNNFSVESFLRVNNIFDKLYYTQWSLPEAGRQFRFGLKLKI